MQETAQEQETAKRHETVENPTADKPSVKLTGQDGNAFMIIGLCNRAARKAGWSKQRVDTFMAKATSGDYDHLLQTAMEFFDVE